MAKKDAEATITGRKVYDCAAEPEHDCSLVISGEEEEVVDVVKRHLIDDHGEKEDGDLDDKVRSALMDEVDEDEISDELSPAETGAESAEKEDEDGDKDEDEEEE